MQKIIVWAKKSKIEIAQYIQKRQYTKLLNEYCKIAGYSTTKTAAVFKCSRRAMQRYLSGERMVPMYIVNQIMNEMGTTKEEICCAVEAEKDTGEKCDLDCKIEGEFDSDGMFVWYGNAKKILFNILYAYRTLIKKQSRFQAACELDILESTLYEYECGKRKIQQADIIKILNGYNMRLEELFPSLVSYDGRKTFLPLNPVMSLNLDGKDYDLLEDKLYVADDGGIVDSWPVFPIQRYDADGRPLLKYMPDELTIDEYANSDELIFIKDDFTYYEKDIDGLKLPPNYLPFFGKDIVKNKQKNSQAGRHVKFVTQPEFLPDYKISLKSTTRKTTFSLQDYVFSNSPWYAMLRDEEYFQKGELKFIGEKIPENECIVWPDGQYVRILELYIAKYPYQYKYLKHAFVCNGPYLNWTIYEAKE